MKGCGTLETINFGLGMAADIAKFRMHNVLMNNILTMAGN